MSKSMSKAAVSRIQSASAKANGGSVSKGSFAARATSTAAKSSNVKSPGKVSSNGRGNAHRQRGK